MHRGGEVKGQHKEVGFGAAKGNRAGERHGKKVVWKEVDNIGHGAKQPRRSALPRGDIAGNIGKVNTKKGGKTE